jgi:hypothetical protein
LRAILVLGPVYLAIFSFTLDGVVNVELGRCVGIGFASRCGSWGSFS